METTNPCLGCQHEIMCAWKEEYKQLNLKFNKFFDDVDINKFRGNLFCFYNSSNEQDYLI